MALADPLGLDPMGQRAEGDAVTQGDAILNFWASVWLIIFGLTLVGIGIWGVARLWHEVWR